MVLPSLTGPSPSALLPIVPGVRSGRPMLLYEQGLAPARSLAVGAVTRLDSGGRPGDGPATGRRASSCAVLAVIRAAIGPGLPVGSIGRADSAAGGHGPRRAGPAAAEKVNGRCSLSFKRSSCFKVWTSPAGARPAGRAGPGGPGGYRLDFS